ncbi:MAG: hypothetical protein ACNY01_11955 [Desulfobacteria bacterium]|jgi:predicted nucleic acid-binding protein|nr:MAG: hypothetical protein BA868_06300 [Desulfobacterales bacterium C00003106]OEU58340.1 MAG: hypothetical protein BAW33_05215 [Desulfobacterales bacterium C00003104]
MTVFDADILSMFAKADAIHLLKRLFAEKGVMTSKIRDEISVPLEYGYIFPLEVLSTIKTVSLSNQALEKYEKLQEDLSLGKGELEAIAYCKTENSVFATNDIKARKLAKHAGVSVVSLQAILKALWKKKIMTKEEVGQLLAKIKDTDNLALSGAVEREIFAEANSGEKDGC